MKTIFTTLFIFLICFSISSSEQVQKFSRIKIFVPDQSTLQNIWHTGIDYEGVTGKIGGDMEFVVSEFELQQLQAKNISYQILVDDLSKEYQHRINPIPPLVKSGGFHYGSMGGFYTFTEVVRQLDSMHLLYPTIISARESIGTTREGRALWAVKISDHPNLDEFVEPQVLYTAIHHAREPEGMMSLMYYMWWLLENYGANQQATYLVNNRQMYFIPVVNPDGYVYNQTTNPNGGGYWRKNRRNNGDGTFGVDPNRNYGPDYMWDSPNGGSSTSTSSDTYRGDTPFSEPENLAIDNFMRTHNVKTCLNYHTYGNYLIYPFGYLSSENGDSLIFRDITYVMTSFNNYTSGTDLQTVNYSTRGNSDDYMFGDTTKPRTWTMTPEVGTTGFWPSVAEIFPLAMENLEPNKYISYVGGQTSHMRRYSFSDANGDGFLSRNENVTLNLTLRNFGISVGKNLTITLSSTPNIEFNSLTKSIPAFPSLSDSTVQFFGTVPIGATEGVPSTLYITTTDLDGFEWKDSIRIVIGIPSVLFSDSASNGSSNWTSVEGWAATTEQFHTPPASFTDSPNHAYTSDANATLTQNTPINLTGYSYASLEYWAKWAVEPTYDFATVEISTNNGSSWSTLRSALMQRGSGRSSGIQDSGMYGYDGYTPGLTFVRQEINLSQYIGSTIKIRFHLQSDGGENRDGMYVDDIRILGYHQSLTNSIIISPYQFSFSGIPGQEFNDQVHILNNTGDSVHISIAETTVTSTAKSFSPPAYSIPTSISYWKSVLQKNRNKFQSLQLHSGLIDDNVGKAYSTIISDARGDNFIEGVDVRRIDFQKRTLPPPFNTLLDFRVYMSAPDSNVIGVLSFDVDQDFGTGIYPSPQGIGSPACDVGAEFQTICVLSTEVAESLGLGSVPFVAVISTATDSIVGIPLPLTVARDSLMLASFSLPQSYFEEEGNMNISSFFVNYRGNPIPDYAPDFGHGIIGTESGVSWVRESSQFFDLASGDSALLDIRVLTSKAPGSYQAQLIFSISTQPSQTVPIFLHVNTPPPSHAIVSPLAIHDTLVNEDSLVNPITITNTGGGRLVYALVDTFRTPWIQIENGFGSLDSDQTLEVQIVAHPPKFIDYNLSLILSTNDDQLRQIIIPVTIKHQEVLSVNEPTEGLPKEVMMKQNFPNPFNPVTTIEFTLPQPMYVTLKVYDLLGSEIVILENGVREAGYHTKIFDATSFPSGIYYYRLTAIQNGTIRFEQTKKLLLIK